MNYLSEFLVIALTAIVMQNAVFTRGLGSSKDTVMLAGHRPILLFGGTLTLISVCSALLAWPLTQLIKRYRLNVTLGIRYTTSLVTLCCICFVFAVIFLTTRAYLPRLHYKLRTVAVPAAFNCAVLGAIVIGFSGDASFVKAIGFTFGSGIGYTIAMLMVYEGRRRIALSDVPKSFRGMPSLLLYIGIVSLAIYGLIGHQLPT